MKVVKYYDNRYDEDTTAQFKITYKDGSTVTAKIDEEIDLKTGNPNTYTLVCRYTEYGELKIANCSAPSDLRVTIIWNLKLKSAKPQHTKTSNTSLKK